MIFNKKNQLFIKLLMTRFHISMNEKYPNLYPNFIHVPLNFIHAPLFDLAHNNYNNYLAF